MPYLAVLCRSVGLPDLICCPIPVHCTIAAQAVNTVRKSFKSRHEIGSNETQRIRNQIGLALCRDPEPLLICAEMPE